jgi:hypothetical protein
MPLDVVTLAAEFVPDLSGLDRAMRDADTRLQAWERRSRETFGRAPVSPTSRSGPDPIGDTGARAAKAEREVLSYASAIARLQQAEGNTAAASRTLQDALSKVNQESVEGVRARTQLARVTRQLEEAQRGAEGSAKGLGAGVGSLKGALGAVGIGLGVAELINYGRGALDAANNLELTESTVRALAGSQERYAEVLAVAEAGQQKYGGTLQENLQGLGSLVNLSNRSSVALTDLDNVSRRLATVDPLQGISGANYALKELLGGEGATSTRSLRERFELDPKILDVLEQKGLSAAEKMRLLDEALNTLGITQEVLDNRAETTAQTYVRFGGTMSDVKDAAGKLIAEGLEPVAEVLDRVGRAALGGKREMAELKAGWELFLQGRTVTAEGVEGLDAAAIARARLSNAGFDRGSEVAIRVTAALDPNNEAALTKTREQLVQLRSDAERLSRTNEDTAKSVDRVVEAFATTGDVEGLRVQLGALSMGAGAYNVYRQAALASALSAKQHGEAAELDEKAIEKLQNQLEQTAERGAAAQERLADAQAQYADETETRRRDHAERMASLQADLGERLARLDREYQRDGLQAAEDFERQIADVRADGYGRLAELDAAAQQDREDAAREHAATIAELQDRLAAMERDGAAEIAERTRDAEERLTDLRTRASDSREDRAADHVDRMADLQERLNSADDEEARAKAQRDIERAERDYQQKEERAARDLARQEERLQRERQQDEAAAREKAEAQRAAIERQIAAEQQAYTRAEQERQARLVAERQAIAADAQAKLTELEATYDREQAARQTRYEEERTDAQTAAAEQLADLKEANARLEEERRASYARQRADLQKALGEQLAEAITFQQGLGQLTPEQAQRKLTAVTERFGYTSGEDRRAFDAVFSGMDGGKGGLSAALGGRAGALLGSQTVIINVQAVRGYGRLSTGAEGAR